MALLIFENKNTYLCKMSVTIHGYNITVYHTI